MKKKLLSFSIAGVVANDRGADIAADILGRIDALAKAATGYFRIFGIEVGEVVHVGEDCIAIFSKELAGIPELHPLNEKNLDGAMDRIHSVYADATARYREAREKNLAVPKRPEDARALALNEAAWNLVGSKSSVELVPDDLSNKKLSASDPTQLRIVRLDETKETLIEGALVKGGRIVEKFTRDMFPDLDREVSAIITLDGPVPEISHRLSIRELQSVFQGYTLVRARVAGRHGEIPTVKGGFASERLDR